MQIIKGTVVEVGGEKRIKGSDEELYLVNKNSSVDPSYEFCIGRVVDSLEPGNNVLISIKRRENCELVVRPIMGIENVMQRLFGNEIPESFNFYENLLVGEGSLEKKIGLDKGLTPQDIQKCADAYADSLQKPKDERTSYRTGEVVIVGGEMMIRSRGKDYHISGTDHPSYKWDAGIVNLPFRRKRWIFFNEGDKVHLSKIKESEKKCELRILGLNSGDEARYLELFDNKPAPSSERGDAFSYEQWVYRRTSQTMTNKAILNIRQDKDVA